MIITECQELGHNWEGILDSKNRLATILCISQGCRQSYYIKPGDRITDDCDHEWKPINQTRQRRCLVCNRLGATLTETEPT